MAFANDCLRSFAFLNGIADGVASRNIRFAQEERCGCSEQFAVARTVSEQELAQGCFALVHIPLR